MTQRRRGYIDVRKEFQHGKNEARRRLKYAINSNEKYKWECRIHKTYMNKHQYRY